MSGPDWPTGGLPHGEHPHDYGGESATDEPIRPSAETVGGLFEDEHGQQWWHIGFSALPTVVLEREDDLPVRVTAATGSAFAHGLRLVES